jgi:membrane-bound metal-dependent hydrolase YbcI (DUF457 family)
VVQIHSPQFLEKKRDCPFEEEGQSSFFPDPCRLPPMKIPEHVALSYLLAQLGVQQQYGPWGTALMVAAGCLPDLDGVAIVAGWRYYRTYHRILGHGLPLTLAGPLALAAIGSLVMSLGPLWPLWGWLQLSLLAHLFVDVCYYRWPVRLLWPVRNDGWGFGLLSWNDLVPTLSLYAATAVAIAWPATAPACAAVAVGVNLLYLGWRVWQPEPITGWGAWLAGEWTRDTPRIWRWLTGDFVT